MPNEPEREIEKTLKAYAKQRRDQAGTPPPMHPATRKMLREEALRTHSASRSSAGSWGGFFWSWWPRLAVGAAVVVCAGLGGWFLWSGSRPQPAGITFALNKAPSFSAGVPKAEPMSAATPSVQRLAEDLEKPMDQNGAVDKITEKKPAPPMTRMSGAATITTQSGNGNVDSFKATALSDTALDLSKAQPPPAVYNGGVNGQVVATNQVALIAGTSATLASDDRKTDGALGGANYNFDAGHGVTGGFGGGGGGGGQFNRTQAAFVTRAYAQGVQDQVMVDSQRADTAGQEAKKLAVPMVLASFRVEQSNGQIRVIDSDGSVYSGAMVKQDEEALSEVSAGNTRSREQRAAAKDIAAPASAALPSLPPGAAANSPAPVVAPPQNIFFRVSGTNRSLNQVVVFNGQLLMVSRQLPAAAANETAGEIGGKLKMDAGAGWSQLSGKQVVGSVLIGGTNQVEINAEPAKR